MKLDHNKILYIPKQIYSYQVNNFVGLYNPFSYKGIVVINKKAKKILDSIDGKRSINEIISCNNKILSPKEILSLIKKLIKNHIVSFTQKDKLHFSPSFSISKSLTLWLQLTNQCNFRCTYCFIERNNDNFTPEKINKLFKVLSPLQKKYDFKVIKIIIGGGEPLIKFPLVKHIVLTAESHRKKIPIMINLITNGSLITKEIVHFLKTHHVNIGVSLDGIGIANDLTRKLINNKGTFYYIKRGLEILKENGVRFNISTTVTKKNVKHLKELSLYCSEQKIPMSLGFYSKLNTFCKEDPIKENDEEFIKEYKKFLTFLYNYYSSHKLKYSPLKYNNLLYPSRILYYPYYESCLAGLNYFSIFPDETVHFCPGSRVALSSLNSIDFIKEARKNYSKLFKDKSIDNFNKCRKCRWRYICAGGCKQERIESSNTAVPIKCAIYKKIIPHIINLEIKRIIGLRISIHSDG